MQLILNRISSEYLSLYIFLSHAHFSSITHDVTIRISAVSRRLIIDLDTHSLSVFSVSESCPKCLCSAAHAFPQLSPTDNTPQIFRRKSQWASGAKVITKTSTWITLSLSPGKIPLLLTWLTPTTHVGIFVVAYNFLRWLLKKKKHEPQAVVVVSFSKP